jgi:hypothetical protein
VLATLIDLIIIYLPTTLLAYTVFGESSSEGSLLSGILFLIYNLIASESFSGKTIGKYFAKLHSVHDTSDKLGRSIREGVKILYFLPIAGPIFILITLLCYLVKGRTLHDWIGKSNVCVG